MYTAHLSHFMLVMQFDVHLYLCILRTEVCGFNKIHNILVFHTTISMHGNSFSLMDDALNMRETNDRYTPCVGSCKPLKVLHKGHSQYIYVILVGTLHVCNICGDITRV
jgi:hypothetical protein